MMNTKACQMTKPLRFHMEMTANHRAAKAGIFILYDRSLSNIYIYASLGAVSLRRNSKFTVLVRRVLIKSSNGWLGRGHPECRDVSGTEQISYHFRRPCS
jgi:hypothetical protein